jgi:hypothetical protein
MATTQFCLTNPGTNLVGPTVSLLSNLDNFTTPFQTGISLSSLQPPNCPATLTVPDTATQIKVLDPNTNQCAAVNLLGNDLCTLFNLTFSDVQTNTVSQIIFGDITSSFGVVTDYLIYWYRNGESSPQYISGKGTLFQPYSFTHPLTNSSTILAQSGVYTIEIAKIQINGINFTTLDTPPSGFVKMTASCLPTITVTAFNCSNGTFTSTNLDLDYTHFFSFDNASVGTSPSSLSATFDLSTDTNYLAFRFVANEIYDILRITFYGNNYPNPIVLENLAVGNNSNTAPGQGGFIPNAPLKSITLTEFRKVLNLSMLNKSPGDYLSITVTPNPTFNQTTWSLMLKCFTTFDCTDCTDQFINQHPKIYLSDISSTLQTCNNVNVNFKYQACLSSVLASPIRKYMSFQNGVMAASASDQSPPKKVASGSSNASIRTCTYTTSQGGPPSCSASPQGTTTLTTSSSNNTFTSNYQFSNSSNFNLFINNFLTELSNERGLFPNYNNPLDADYFRFMNLRVPSSNGCGDSVGFVTIHIPLWANYNIDYTTNILTVTYDSIPSNTASNYITENSITNCDSGCAANLNNTINLLNGQISTPINITNSTGGYYTNNFNLTGGFVQGDTQFTNAVVNSEGVIRAYSNVTYMMNTSNQLIDNTPYKVCDFESLGGFPLNQNLTYNVTSNLGQYNRKFFYFDIQARVPFNPSYPDDFTIYSRYMSNGQFVLPDVIVYQKLNGVISTNNDFMI